MSWDESLPVWPAFAEPVPNPQHEQWAHPKSPAGMDVRVLTAVVGAPEGDVARAVAGAQSLTLARRCADAAELLGAAQAGLGSVAVISSDLVGFDRVLIDGLARESVRVVAINNPLDQFSADRLTALGVSHWVPNDVVESELADAIRAAVDPSAGQETPGPANIWPGDPAPGPQLHENTRSRPRTRGRIIAVWGTHGAPGRSTLASGIAFALAEHPLRTPTTLEAAEESSEITTDPPRKRGRTTKRGTVGATGAHNGAHVLLVDADTYAPSLTQGLGLLEESSGLAVACRAAGTATLSPEALSHATQHITDHVGLLTGLPRTTRWPELGARQLRDVLDVAVLEHDWVVVDCAAPIEEDELISFDMPAPARNAATLTALDSADLIIVVGRADPVGIKRLIASLEMRSERPSIATAPYLAVVNQAPAGRAATRKRAEIAQALAKYSGEVEPLFVGYDPLAVEQSLNVGRAVTEGKPSKLRESVEELAVVIAAGFGA